MANIERIKEVVALIEKDEREHKGKHFDMDCWVTPPEDGSLPAFCNTKMCFAGWTLIAQIGSIEEFLKRALTRWDDEPDSEWETSSWADFYIEKEAREYLGLDSYQAARIFYDTGIENTQQLKERITFWLDTEIWPGIISTQMNELDHLEPTHLVCQFCGLSTDARSDDAKNWFVSPHRHTKGLWVIRCPLHISEWAMRNSREGRTRSARKKAKWGREQWLKTWAVPPIPMPVPSRFQGAQTSQDRPEST